MVGGFEPGRRTTEHAGHHFAESAVRGHDGGPDATDAQLRFAGQRLLDGLRQRRHPRSEKLLAFRSGSSRRPTRSARPRSRPSDELAYDRHVIVAVHAGSGAAASDCSCRPSLTHRSPPPTGDLSGTRSMFFDQGVEDDVVDRHPRLDQQVLDGLVQLVIANTQPSQQRALRVGSRQQADAVSGEARAQVDGRWSLQRRPSRCTSR